MKADSNGIKGDLVMAKKAHTKARKGQKAKPLKLLPHSFLKSSGRLSGAFRSGPKGSK